jgi:glyoxylase-like metal-dependent hydrolase (beta-lactamase superfamily II)
MTNEHDVAVIESPIFAENCYVAHLRGRSDCLVVDPGIAPEEILEVLHQNHWTPAAILNTHGHADHIAGNGRLKQRFPDAPLIIGREDASKLTNPTENLSSVYGLPLTSPPADRLVDHGDQFTLAGFDLEVRLAPGHSRGHVVFVWKAPSPWLVFGGDVLFAGSIGRSDFPDSDPQALLRSIDAQLFTLPDDTQVLPGHGPPTTIGEEKRTNPFIRQVR